MTIGTILILIVQPMEIIQKIESTQTKGNSMLKKVLDIIISYLMIYLFGAYIIFLVKSLIYGKEKFYGSEKPTLMEKIKKYFFNKSFNL